MLVGRYRALTIMARLFRANMTLPTPAYACHVRVKATFQLIYGRDASISEIVRYARP